MTTTADLLPETSRALATVIGQAMGGASMCWIGGTGDLVFDSERAVALVDETVAKVKELTGLGEPSLGCATNKQLRDELEARTRLGHTEPDYRTLDG